MGILDYIGLGANINKHKAETPETKEGVVSDFLPELELKMSEEELSELTIKWRNNWDNSKEKTEWIKIWEDNEKYWLGKQFSVAEIEEFHPLIDNIVFESLETFLPQATRRNPQAQVEVKGTKELQTKVTAAMAEMIEERLNSWADNTKLRLKIKRAARNWSIYLLGVAKIGWNMKNSDVGLQIIRPQKLILDPDGITDEDGYDGEYIGEYRKMTAARLVEITPKYKKEIEELVKGEMGTKVQFIEWWTNEYTCWTLGPHVLLKKKNPHWNYDTDTKQEQVDEYGNTTEQGVRIPGKNHFLTPRIPYIFLSIFNLGKGPTDITSLISQGISTQDLINKRYRQIDHNVDFQNEGMVVSGERSGLTKDEAAQASMALRQGKVIYINNGAPRDAVDRLPAPALPSDIYNQLLDARNRFRDVFGVRGSTPAGIENEDTVRGKIITRGLDTDRIGGGITEYLEQFSDDVYNWVYQMLLVYLPDLQQIELPPFKISVSEGSLLPKDNVTIANQAIELANAGKMSLLDLYERLEYPNPEQMAANVWLEQNAPQMLYANDQRVQMALGMIQQAQAQQMQQQGAQEAQGKQQDFQNQQQLQQQKTEGELLKQVNIPKS